MKTGPTILEVSAQDRFRTVDQLLKEGDHSQMFYVMLVLSSLIIAGGVILGNISVLIGGMLVTPVLTQVLILALGFSTGQVHLIRRTSEFILKITLAIIVGSFILGLIFGNDVLYPVITDNLSAAFLYFVIAIASGIAATIAWIHRSMSEILPGVAIAVALVPPLSYIGVALSQGDGSVASLYLVIYILNLFGIVLGSLGVFLLSQFGGEQETVEQHEAVAIVRENAITNDEK